MTDEPESNKEVLHAQKEVASANSAGSSSKASPLEEGLAKAACLVHHLSSNYQLHSSAKTGKDRIVNIFGTPALDRITETFQLI